jgi:LmbE family N-acetylglucosaminyl deacetylase
MPRTTRRSLLLRAGTLGAALATRPALADNARDAPPKLKVVITGGHPGDPEYGCGGTVARLTDLGHEVVFLYLNNGEPAGKRGAGAVRMAEAARACEILKARPVYAGQIDGEAIVDQAHYRAFRELLDAERPDAVFTHWPIDNHADHRAISLLAYDAWLQSSRRFAFYYYEVSNGEDTVQFTPTDYVDITAAEPRKRQACFAHASQAPERFYATQDHVARFRGIERGFGRAEAFIRHVQSRAIPLPTSS